MPANAIYHIFQDSKGYMWFSSDNGLIKYDGFEFTTFSNKQQSSRSGTNIQEDKYGRIWYQNFDGYVFYVEKDSLYRLSQNTPVGYFNYGVIGDHLFLMQANGLDIVDIGSLRIKKHIYIDTKKISFSANDRYNYYVYNDRILHILNKELKDDSIRIPGELDKNGYSKFISSPNGVFIYANNNSLLRRCYYVSKTGIRASFPLSLENVQNAAFSGNAFWFCTPNGAYQVDSGGHMENNGNAFFKDHNISYVFKDRENNFWFATLNEGLLLVKNLDSRRYFSAIHPARSSLYANTLYIGAEGQLYKINLKNLEIKPVYKSPYNKEITTIYYDSIHKNILLSNNEIECINKNFEGEWHANGAMKDARLIDSNYYAFALSGACALYRIDKSKPDKWTGIYNRYQNGSFPYARFVLGSRAKAVEYDALNSIIYFGTSYGLKILTPKDLGEIKIDTARLYIKTLCKYGQAIYGLSTAGELIQITNTKARYVNLSFPEKDETVTFIKICGRYLFLTTNESLFSIDLDDPLLRLDHRHKINYDLMDIELWQQQMIIITRNGVITEQLRKDNEQKASPLFYITKLTANGKSAEFGKPFELEHDQNTVEISYVILNFNPDFTYPLYYKVNQQPWEKNGNQARSLKLPLLAPGNYKIVFKPGSPNASGPGMRTIEFTINKAWWQTWWFIGGCAFLIIFSIVIIARWRIYELNQKNKLLSEKIDNEQKYYKTSLKAIKAQMNPHFFYNALNTIQSFIYSEDKKNASTYLSKFSKLTRLILEMSEKDTVALSEEISTLQLYLEIERARFNDDFNFFIKPPDAVHPALIAFPPMLIQPYVENAIKHGLLHKKGMKKLEIRFELKASLLFVSIQDNGIGRRQSREINSKKSNMHESFSSAANEARFKILREKNILSGVKVVDEFDEYQQPAGTTVNLVIPVILTQK